MPAVCDHHRVPHVRRSITAPRRVLSVLAALLALPLGCANRDGEISADDPELAEYVELVMPAEIRILEWTKPVSLSASGTADALEAIVEARDRDDDLTKVVGKFHFELKSRRPSDPIGTRVSFWAVNVNSTEAMRLYRDRLSRFYHFPLQLEDPPLKPGRYILSVWLHLPTGTRLYDEYEFDFDGGSAPPPSAF